MQNKCPSQEKKNMIARRRYKVRVLTQPSIQISTASTPTVATVNMQTPVTRYTAAMSISIIMYNLATGKFRQTPCPPTIIQSSNPPPLEDIPSAPVRQGTSWPNAASVEEKLFETRKDWPIPLPPSPHLPPPSRPKKTHK